MRKPTGKQFRDASGVVVGMASEAANGDGSVYFDASRNRNRATFIDLEGRRHAVLGKTSGSVVETRRQDRRDDRTPCLSARILAEG